MNLIPVTVFISALVALAGLAWGIIAQVRSAIYKDVYERELATLIKRMERLEALVHQNQLALATLTQTVTDLVHKT